MGIEREFGRYGAKLVNRYCPTSALTDAPRELGVGRALHLAPSLADRLNPAHEAAHAARCQAWEF